MRYRVQARVYTRGLTEKVDAEVEAESVSEAAEKLHQQARAAYDDLSHFELRRVTPI